VAHCVRNPPCRRPSSAHAIALERKRPDLAEASRARGLSWGSIGAVITVLLPDDVSWFAVMPVLMVSALAGIWSHVPGGLGVVEAVFLALLETSAPDSLVLASILVYRLLYYLVPFALAIAAYVFLEASGRTFHEQSGKVRGWRRDPKADKPAK
jgi:hypothetical protein